MSEMVSSLLASEPALHNLLGWAMIVTGVCVICAGQYRSMAVVEDGHIVGFGSNGGGALGLGDDVWEQLTPLQYPDLLLRCA